MQEDWRKSNTYSYLDGLRPAAVAWEFMRRNPDYRTAYRSVLVGIAGSLARRWGCVVDPDLRADHARVAWLLSTELT